MILLFNFLLFSEDCKDAIPANNPFSLINCSPNTYPNDPNETFQDTFTRYINVELPRYFQSNIEPYGLIKEVKKNNISLESVKSCHFICSQTGCESAIKLPLEEICLNPNTVQNTTLLIGFEDLRNKDFNKPLPSNPMVSNYQDFIDFQKNPNVFEKLINYCTPFIKKDNLINLDNIFLDALFANINFCQYAQMPNTSTSITAKFIQERQKVCTNVLPMIKFLPGSIPNTQVPTEQEIKPIPEVDPGVPPENSLLIPDEGEEILPENNLPENNLNSSIVPPNNNTSSVTNPAVVPTVAPIPSPQVSSLTISLTALLGFLQALMPEANTPTPYAPPPQSYAPNYSQYGMPYPAPMGPIGLPAVVNNPLFMMQGFSGYGYPMPYVWSPFVPGFFNPYNSNPPPENPKSNEIPTPSTQPASDNSEPNWFRSLLNSF